MKHLKEFKLFESIDLNREVIEDLLRDFSDNDIPVDVDIHQLDPSVAWFSTAESRVIIFIGKEDNLIQSKDLAYENIDNFISLNDYLTDEGYQLKSIACWIKPNNEPVTGQRPITIREFDKFISKIEEIEKFNRKNPPILHKSFKLIDLCYKK